MTRFTAEWLSLREPHDRASRNPSILGAVVDAFQGATSIRVVEIVPPATDTDLGGAGLHKFGVTVDALLDDVLPRIANGELEVAHGTARKSSRATRDELDEIFRRMNEPPA